MSTTAPPLWNVVFDHTGGGGGADESQMTRNCLRSRCSYDHSERPGKIVALNLFRRQKNALREDLLRPWSRACAINFGLVGSSVSCRTSLQAR